MAVDACRDQHVYVVFDKDLVITRYARRVNEGTRHAMIRLITPGRMWPTLARTRRHSMPPLTGGGWNQGIFLDPIVAAFPDVPRA